MKAQLTPRIATPGLPGFLLWARRDNPALYSGMVQSIPEVAQFEAALRADGLNGLFDTLKTIGSSLTSAAGKIGTFVAKNALPIATAVVPLVVAKKQADIAKSQYRLATAQQAPMQTAVVDPSTGFAVPVQQVNGQWQQVPLSAGAAAQLQAIASQARAPQSVSAPLLGVPLWGWLVGAGALGLVVLARR